MSDHLDIERGPQVVALAVFVIALWAQSPEAYAGVTDDGLHLVLAKAIARGEGLHFIHQPGSPPAAFFPPLFALVAGIVGIVFPSFPANLLLVQIFNAAALAGAAWLAIDLVRAHHVPRSLAYTVVVIAFWNVAVLSTSVRSFPEPLLLLLWFASLAATRRAATHARWALAAGALAGFAVLTTHAGWAVPVGVVAGLLVRRRAAAAAAALGITAVVVTPWLIWSFVVGPDPLASISVARAMAAVSPTWSDAVLPLGPGGGLLSIAVAVLLPLVALVGVWRTSRETPEWAVTVAAFALSLLIVPATSRSVWITFPSVVGFAAIGGVWLWTTCVGARRPLLIATSVIVGTTVILNAAGIAGRRFVPAMSEVTQETSRLFIAGVGTETPAGAVVATDADMLLHLYTERPTIPILSPEAVDSYCAQGAEYLAYSGLRSETTNPSVLPSAVEIFAVSDGPSLLRLPCAP